MLIILSKDYLKSVESNSRHFKLYLCRKFTYFSKKIKLTEGNYSPVKFKYHIITLYHIVLSYIYNCLESSTYGECKMISVSYYFLRFAKNTNCL